MGIEKWFGFRRGEEVEGGKPEQKEKEGYSSRIVMSFRRHGKKQKVAEGQQDWEVELTPEGRKQAKAEASEETDLGQSVAYGSPRVRSQQTAGLEMAGAHDDITGEESYEELKQKLDTGRAVGTKLGADVRLDFPEKSGSPYLEKVDEAYAKGFLLKYLVNESDKDAEAAGDEVTYTYSRSARQMAQIFQKYRKVAGAWDKLVQKSDQGESGYTEDLERFFGTHASLGESFLAKVIEQTKGVEEREKFVEALGGNSFDSAEGFKAEVINHSGQEPTLRITYRKEEEGKTVYEFNEEVSWEVIDQIAELR